MTDTGHDNGRYAAYAHLACALAEDDRDAARRALAQVATDPEQGELLRRHHLITPLWATIPEDELRRRAPGAHAAAAAWRSQRCASSEDSLRTIDELQAALKADRIECMVLKGVYFAHRLYGGLHRRTQHDIDLLVRRRDFRRAAGVLRAHGFTERSRDMHSVTWARDGARVDLHWCFRNTPIYRLDEDRIWRDRLSYTIATTTFATPSDSDALVALALGLFQDLGLGSAKLKQLVDVHLLIAAVDRTFDWQRFFAARRADGTLAVVVGVLDLVLQLFDASQAGTRLAAALRPHVERIATPDEARRLVFAERGSVANRAWFFRVYPGSIVRYWLWLLPRKLPAYVRGSAPTRGRTSMRPSLATLRAIVSARRPP